MKTVHSSTQPKNCFVEEFFNDPKKVFLLFGIVFGLILVFLTAPFQAPDEFIHYDRAYLLSQGRTPSASPKHGYHAMLPKSITTTFAPYHQILFQIDKKADVRTILDLLKYPLAPEATEVFLMDRFQILPYLPAAIGMAAGRVCQASPMLIMYLGRLTNWLTWLTLVYFAIKITPIFKWMFCLLALLPLSLFLAASLSYDAFNNGITFYFIALVLRCALDDSWLINFKTILKLFLVSLLVALTKSLYVCLCLLFFLIPISKLGSKLRYFATFLVIIFFNLAVTALWNHYSVTTVSTGGVTQWASNSSIFDKTLQYSIVLKNTFFGLGYYYLQGFLGILGWLDTFLPLPAMLFEALILLLTALYDKNSRFNVSGKAKVILGSIILLVANGVFLGVYLLWNHGKGTQVLGVQARYFIPLAPLFFLLFYNQRLHPAQANGVGKVVSIGLSVILPVTVWTILQRYYL